MDYRLISLAQVKNRIFSSFNTLRKSNVGLISCNIMKKAYKRATLDIINKKAEKTQNVVNEIKENIFDLKQDLASTLERGQQISYERKIQTENVSNFAEKVDIANSFISQQQDINKETTKLGKELKKENKRLEKAEEKLEMFKALKEKKEQNIEKPSSISYDEDLTRQDNLNEFYEEVNDELDEGSSGSGEVIEESVVQENDPLENLQVAFNNFITQIKKERELSDKDKVLNQQLKEENKNLISRNQQLEQNIDVLKAENRKLNDNISEANEIAEAINQEVEQKINQANKTIKMEKKEIERLKHENEELKKKNNNLTKDNSNLSSKLDEKTKEISVIRQQFTQLTNVIDSVNAQMSNESSTDSQEKGMQYIKQQ